MKIGFCGPADQAAHAKAAGCDYIELNFTTVTRMDEAQFTQAKVELAAAGLQSEVMNCFIPADFNLFSLEDGTALEAYMRKGMARAKEMGTELIVFGSAGARKLPAGVERPEGLAKLERWFRLAGELAIEFGLIIVIEPLAYKEDNAVNTVLEGLALMKKIDIPGLRLLADLNHMGYNGEDCAGILQAGADLLHCHIANPVGRVYPMPGDGYDYLPFFAALRGISYAGRLSVEASPVNGPEDLAVSVQYCRDLT